MKAWSTILAMLAADLRERTRRTSYLVTLCLAIYLGFAVNTGQILILLEDYRGVYNSAWVGSLMALVITFFLGILGFFLVKDTIQRDERTGVGQIIATTSLTRLQYLFGKWLSNLAVLATQMGILALAAVLMQLLQREDVQIRLWPFLAPFLLIALPVLTLVAALAVFFETVRWLKGGFGNLVYFVLFIFLLIGVPQLTGLDPIGLFTVGASMRAAARAAFAGYGGTFTLSMISGEPAATFAWQGLDWTASLVLQRLLWVVLAVGVVLAGSLTFDRFDPARRSPARRRRQRQPEGSLQAEPPAPVVAQTVRLTPLPGERRFHANVLRLAWLELLLLVKGLRWYWLGGMAALWLGCAATPDATIRRLCFMLAAIWPVLVWSKMGEREARYQAEQLVFQAAHPLVRLLAPAWLAGLLFTAAAASGALLGRLVYGEPLALLPWLLSVLLIPTLALALGVWSRSSKLFEVVYPILWYLGPFNPQSQLAVLDYLGVHAGSPVVTAPLAIVGLVAVLLLLAVVGRRRQIAI